MTCADSVYIQGTKDVVYSVANAQEEIKLFINSPDARLELIPGGEHFLSASHPKEVTEHMLAFVGKYAK
jgi:pimeloyl-ACP methyl ester carboxylesterase